MMDSLVPFRIGRLIIWLRIRQYLLSPLAFASLVQYLLLAI